jgi:signal transduction histidine kinase
MGCAFATLIIWAIFGAIALVSMFFRSPQPAVAIAAIAIAIAVALVAGFVLAIRRASRFFSAQDRLRRQLMADVAHELRTPLAILQGRIEGLIDGVYPRDDGRMTALLEETQHLSRLVEDLRTLANAEAGALDLRKELVDPVDIIRDVAGAFDRKIEVDAPDELPLIDVDPVRVREILLNLLSNAVRHTPTTGTISIHAEMQPRRLIIRVTDTGSGIPSDDLPRIFERFHKGRDSHGSGLGLAIARTLVLAHGGDIHVESIVGKGTTVTVELPR